MIITALCKVVDNYGDVGVVWRMCRNLKFQNPECEINLVIDDLVSFNKICSQVDSTLDFQIVDSVSVYNWNNCDYCHEKFSENDGEKLLIILECFQCGRPEWMEKILFEEKLERTVNIIMIDYLTAEKYAEDFHGLDSLTRSAKVQKVNFMPGFTEKTGGLIIDNNWRVLKDWQRAGDILVFTYEKNWSALANALKKSGKKVLLAQGRGRDSFFNASKENGLDITELPYLNQENWDDIMQNCSCLIIRGEESMSRACLSGIPFVWHAYPQSDEYQMVKVNALLDRMERHFEKKDFAIVRNAWNCINENEQNVCSNAAENYYSEFIGNIENLVYGFKEFALDLRKNGDLCSNLMTFIYKKCII